jgi:hypothetical protein
MKNFYFFLISFLFIISAFAQDNSKKRSALGFSFTLHDYKTAAALRSQGLVNLVNNKQLFKLRDMEAGVGINYLRGLSTHLDFISGFDVSSIQSSINSEITAGLNLKLLPDNYIANPFINAGLGANAYSGYFGAFMPVGMGIQFNAADEVFFLITGRYHMPVTQNANSAFFYGITVAVNVGE